MKKIISLFFSLLLLCSFCACDFSVEKEYSIGLGVVPSVAADTKETVQFEATVAAVVLNSDGRIVKCKIDAVQNKVSVKNGVIDDKAYTEEFRTKQEKGADYGMAAASKIGKEWYQQADHFAKYVAGMTAEQVAEIATTSNDYGSPVAADEAVLAGCTVAIPDFISAVLEACKDENKNGFKATDFNLGIAVNSLVEETSLDATSTADGKAIFDISISCVATDKTNKILAAVVDSISPEIPFDAFGKVTLKEGVNLFTKRESGENYGMKDVSKIGKEWFEQAEAFEDYIVGKDAVAINSIKTENGENGIVVSEPDLKAGCTVTVDGFMLCVQKAIKAAETAVK